MKSTQLELTRLIGKKEDASVDAMPATLSDFHRWMRDKICWSQDYSEIEFFSNNGGGLEVPRIHYDSSKDLMEQSDDTLKQIVELIKSNQ